MEQTKRTKLGIGWLIPGAIMLANPVIAFYDILPDCIGYLLLCISLFRLADLNSSIADALKRFRTLIWISGGGLLMQYYIYHVLSKVPKINPHEIPTTILLCAFAYAEIPSPGGAGEKGRQEDLSPEYRSAGSGDPCGVL